LANNWGLAAGAKPDLSRLRTYLSSNMPPTPCLVFDIDIVQKQLDALVLAFPQSLVRYAVKANPAPSVLKLLVGRGLGFDVAGPHEVDLVIKHGANPEHISYGNPIKKATEIARAYSRGVREFTSDSIVDLRHIAEYAPGSAVSIRFMPDGPPSINTFGGKFGCHPDCLLTLVAEANELGLRPGLAFHVGSQQVDPGAWRAAIAVAGNTFRQAADLGIHMRRLNIGGGFAVPYRNNVPSIDQYGSCISEALHTHFRGVELDVLIEPGRFLVAPAGVIHTEVVLVTTRSRSDKQRWVYLDVGRFNGLAETENEIIDYEIVGPRDPDGVTGRVILAGPTCDGLDVLYQDKPYELPVSLKSGDHLEVRDAGAYTASYSSVNFNGIEPLRVYEI
jgi:ornithine decarboxylase